MPKKKVPKVAVPGNLSVSTTLPPPGEQALMVVKFRDDIVLPYSDRVERHLQDLKIGHWDRILRLFPKATLWRLFTSLEPRQIQEIVKLAAARDRTYRPPNFLTYFVLDCPRGTLAKALVEEFRSWAAVQTAYIDPPLVRPQVAVAGNFPAPLQGNQGYLQPKPVGVDAIFAWTKQGGNGSGQTVIDLESGWTTNHQDLVAHAPQNIYGTIDDLWRPHGTGVLGIICAQGDPSGCTGIAYNVGSVYLVSSNDFTSRIADGILTIIAETATPKLVPGDVLLLEVAVGGNLPCEVVDPIFSAIQLATARGIVVIEAAGNAGADLDKRPALNRSPGNHAFRDSGAIMVGAAASEVDEFIELDTPHSEPAHPPDPVSNFGHRIDCYAWGESVFTTSSDTNGAAPATNLYDDNFTGTSAAAAIIAGVALAVQGLAEANGNRQRLDPKEMRELLSDPTIGTPSVDLNTKTLSVTTIGVMPDLNAIFQRL